MFVLLPTLLLACAVADDLYSKKIHNRLLMVFLPFCVLVILFGEDMGFQSTGLSFGFLGLIQAFFRLILALGAALPFVLLRVMGGGDMKLFALLALLLTVSDMFVILLISFFWAGLLGFFKTLLDKKVGLMLLNVYNLFKFKPPSSDELNTFPFSVGLGLAWLTVTFHRAFFYELFSVF